MLTTIEVEIDSSGRVHPLEPLPFVLYGRAYLTMLPDSDVRPDTSHTQHPTAARAPELLASPRFAQRPAAVPAEVQQRIEALRDDCEDR